MPQTMIQTVALGALLGLSSTAFAAFPSFDDLASGDTYYVGGNFASDGIDVDLVPFQWADGTWTNNGVATVSTALWAHGSLNELNTNNINARYNFAGSIGTQSEVRLLFGEYGGNINVVVNGDPANVDNFIDLDGAVLGGCTISVISGGFGGDHGELLITGSIDKLIIGGQELAVDLVIDECEEAFEDLPLDQVYWNGDSFVTNMVPVDVVTFAASDGSPITTGYVLVENWNNACGNGQELFTNNANVAFDFASVSPIENFAFQFGEYGGNINIEINGDFRNVDNYDDLHGLNIGGVLFNVTAGGMGGDCGRVECVGMINTFTAGGQEHFIDCLEWDWVQIPDCEPSYEDLTVGDVYLHGDVFMTDDYNYAVDSFVWDDGTVFNGGYVAVENGGLACSMNNELHYNNATTLIKRLDGDHMENVTFKYGEYGGNVNFEINGDFRNVANMSDLHGAVVGGVTVTVTHLGGSCHQVDLAGVCEYIRIGGQEYWQDCFKADAVAPATPGDVDGDGDVDLDDLLALLAAWGSADANADLNGDGVVNIQDLLILIAAFGP